MRFCQIIVLGRSTESALLGVKERRPDAVDLLYTKATEIVVEPFRQMLDPDTEVHVHLTDPYDREQIMELCRSIHDREGDDCIFVYNITEGTKMQAFSALEVAYEKNATGLYFTQEGERIVFNREYADRSAIKNYITNTEFARLYGNELASYNKVDEMLPIDVVTSREVKSFIEAHPKTFQRIQKQYRREFGGRIEHLPDSFALEHERNTFVHIEDGALKIIEKGKVMFESRNPMATRLFFTGRWWEVLVSDAVIRYDRRRHSYSEVWRNVEFVGKESRKTKNELDILVNDSRRLIFVECKSGYIGQDNIYKIDSTRRTYGGRTSKGLLVSYYPLDPDLVQKCRDLHLYWFAPATDAQRIRHLDNLPAYMDSMLEEIEN